MLKNTQGLLITFEGTEGAGKSTLIHLLAAELQKKGYPVTATREPGGSPVGEKIRAVLLEMTMEPRTELLLYEAARSEHFGQVILPALEQGHIVLCDRFTDSTLAYQSYARGLPWDEVQTLNRIATSGVQPHLTILLEIDPELGLNRAQNPNRFEAEGVEFQKKVFQGFLKAYGEDPQRWFILKVIDRTPEQLMEALLIELKKRFLNFAKFRMEN